MKTTAFQFIVHRSAFIISSVFSGLISSTPKSAMKTKLTALILSLSCLVALLTCQRAPSNQNTGPVVTDATGQTVTINDSSRIVSVGTAVTETIISLGAHDRLV